MHRNILLACISIIPTPLIAMARGNSALEASALTDGSEENHRRFGAAVFSHNGSQRVEVIDAFLVPGTHSSSWSVPVHRHH
jgi:hypothetical protein